jgi:uncharacterized membrane protein YoaK (UPF0700 family)
MRSQTDQREAPTRPTHLNELHRHEVTPAGHNLYTMHSTESDLPGDLIAAILLATTGGLLDAVVYLNDGHVFANTMTGNVIFLGIAALSHDWRDILYHLIPIVAFFAGVSASKHLRTTILPRRAALLGLSFELLALFALGFLPTTVSKALFIAIIAFVSAFQVATFRRVGRISFNSTFLTGNVRDMAEGFYEAHASTATPEDRAKGRTKAIDLSLICLCFLAGAIIGAWAAPRLGNHSLWLPEPLLLGVAIQALRHTA